MRVLDLRPRLERTLASPAAKGATPSLPARLAGRLADRIAAGRAARRQAPPDSTLVVSIGNLRVGGTGKTPVTMALALALADRNIAGAILTRGYGAAEAGPVAVDFDDPRGADEARLMAGALADRPWTVIQSRQRASGLDLALAGEPPPRVVILEDGFQTAAVGRHLDVLILDDWTRGGHTVQPRTGPVLPFGPYRETSRGAARAHLWLLESPDPGAGPTGGPIVCGFTRTMSLRPVRPERPAAADASYGLVAGLARPEGFESGSAALLPRLPVLAVRCRDHSPYDHRLVERILAAGEEQGVGAWVTTGKDWIKLAPVWPDDVPVLVADLEVTWTGSETLPDLVEERLLALGAVGPEG